MNLIVSFYLDFAELQARSRRVMTMCDWIAKLDDFMRISEREILTHAGNVSHEAALARAETEFEKFRTLEAEKKNAKKDARHYGCPSPRIGASARSKCLATARRINPRTNSTS